jgi:two-component system chemotaxis sensor kinase CheA
VLPILDPALLAPSLEEFLGRSLEASPKSAKALPILVVDDSLTTRMLEQSVFEMEGYSVDLASSAEEALDLASKHSYGLFVVDVEMPGMDGITFVARTRHDPILRETPVILVTSRGSAEDKARGLKAGAKEYIVKSNFDQRYLLDRVRELIRHS